MKILLSIFAIALSSHAFADQARIAKAVNAFAGTWVGEMTAVTPFGPPETFQNKVVCRVIASGAGVECSSEAISSRGELTQSCLLAFDPASQLVHYMCVSNMGEVHDHKGGWIDENTIQYEPYKGLVMGEKVTEYVRTSFPDAQTMIHTSVIKTEDGTTMSFEFRAHKQ